MHRFGLYVYGVVWMFGRRTQAQVYPQECYPAADVVGFVYQSIGLTTPHCDCHGVFSSVLEDLNSCVTADSGTVGASVTVTYIQAPMSYCANLAVQSPSSCAASSSSIVGNSTSSDDDVNDIVLFVSMCDSYWNNGQTRLTAAATCQSYFECKSEAFGRGTSTVSLPTSVAIPGTSGSEASSVQTSGASSGSAVLSTGALAGTAVGAALGSMLVLAAVIFFIWRHRRAARRRKTESADVIAGTQEEKAQLHSDEYKPRREELEGSKAAMKVRQIGGLNELEHDPISRVRSEMSANEPAAREMSSTMPSTADSSTLVSSGSRSNLTG